MTGRRLVVLGGAALALAVGGVVARPLLSDLGTPGRHAEVTTATNLVPAPFIDSAVRAARAALACQPGAVPPRGGCGPLTITRTEAFRASPSHITVQLVGSVESSTFATPVALHVELIRSAVGWTPTVALP
jgi:hypothetical protein